METMSKATRAWDTWQLRILVWGLIALLVGCAGVKRAERPATTTRVALRWVGDDGLTQRFTYAFEKAIENEPGLTLAAGNESNGARSLVATIENHLAWKSVGSRVEVSYKIRFDGSTGQKVGGSEGSCWDDELSACVSRAIDDLKRTAKKVDAAQLADPAAGAARRR